MSMRAALQAVSDGSRHLNDNFTCLRVFTAAICSWIDKALGPRESVQRVDYATQISLFTHHMWIGGFCIVGGAAHGAIFMVRDYNPAKNYNNLLDRVVRHRDAIISHLNWVCIFLGFHSFGLYIHNDSATRSV